MTVPHFFCATQRPAMVKAEFQVCLDIQGPPRTCIHVFDISKHLLAIWSALVWSHNWEISWFKFTHQYRSQWESESTKHSSSFWEGFTGKQAKDSIVSYRRSDSHSFRSLGCCDDQKNWSNPVLNEISQLYASEWVISNPKKTEK